MKRVRAGKQFGRMIGRVVVSEPSDAPKRTGRPRSLEILAPNCQRQARSLGQRETHRPDFEVNLVDLAWLERLALVMGISRWLSTRWQCHLPPLQFSERRPVFDPLSVVILQQFSSFSSD
jgi:hypothetical protein